MKIVVPRIEERWPTSSPCILDEEKIEIKCDGIACSRCIYSYENFKKLGRRNESYNNYNN